MPWGRSSVWRRGPRVAVLAFALEMLAPPLPGQEPGPVALAGRVVDARSGEPVAGARVAARALGETVTDTSGAFVLPAIPPGPVELDVTAVGRPSRRLVVRAGTGLPGIEVRLGPEEVRRSEEVAVVDRSLDPAAPASHLLERTELKGLAGVLVDDPLRSVQSLPGVASGDDFGATFAARGQGFSQAGFYIDGVLMSAPFHTIRDVNDGFSLTILNGEVVDALSLVTGAAPARYGGRTGAVLAATIREGSRERLHGRAVVAVSGLSATLEGPLGPSGATSWLFSARKSYLGYVLQRLDEGAMALGFYDATLKVSHHPTPAQALTLGLLHGRSRWTRQDGDIRRYELHTADAGTDLATLQWRWTPSARWWGEATAFFARETGRNRNLDGTDRVRSASGQWGARTEATRAAGPHRLTVGAVVRGLSGEAVAHVFERTPPVYRTTLDDAARSREESAFLEESWTGWGGRLHLTAGGRLDHFAWTGEARATPRAALDLRLPGAARLLAGFGRYAQFPSFAELLGRGGSPDLRAEQATHLTLGLERGLGATASVRVEAYDQRLAGLIANPEADWRLVAGQIVGAETEAPLRNSLSGLSRGIEVTIQRRSARGPSGWAAYTFGRARWREEDGPWFDGDFDQRHTVTVFGSWPIGPTVEVSTKYRYGSGFPVAGYYQPGPGGLYLSSERNDLRPRAYSRWDVRGGKAFVFERWRLTVYAEVLNVLGRRQTRPLGLRSLDVRTGRVVLESDTLFPRLPSAGVAVEF